MAVTLDGVDVLLPTVKTAKFVTNDGGRGPETTIGASNDPKTFSLNLGFPAKTTGTFTCAAGEQPRVLYTGEGVYTASGYGGADSDELLGSCSIIVTAYGAVGELIEGTFTATMPKTVGASTSPAQRQIAKGTFRVVREADL